jgi:virulence factor Mce-like protein
MRRLIVIAGVLLATGAVAVLGTGAGGDAASGGYQVRAIFDNAFSLIEGEDVRISGVNVGKITKLEVTEDNRAAVVMTIDKPGFDDFRQDAKCTIRPQSLIGERYVECSLTQPRPQGDPAPPPLEEIPEGEPGEGQRLLPVDRTSKPVDVDLINNVMRLPQRQRLAIILNELGAGVAGRSRDLNETIRRANPALGAVNEVLEILGEQNQVLRSLAVNSDRVLEPLARDRRSVASFIENAGTVSRATAERRQQLERNFELLPRFLEELRPTMSRLSSFSQEFTPVLTDLQAAAPSINRMFRELGPFSQASIPAFRTLGEAAEVGRPALLASRPIIEDLRELTEQAAPVADDLADLATSLRDTGGIERLMDYIFFQASAINGFDQFGHYLRASLIVNTCSQYSVEPQPGCSANYQRREGQSARAASVRRSNVARVFRDGAPGEDRSAEAMRAKAGGGDAQQPPAAQGSGPSSQPAGGRSAAPGPLKLPSALLPGQDATPAPAPAGGAAAPQAAGAQDPEEAVQQGLLDYLLGGGS